MVSSSSHRHRNISPKDHHRVSLEEFREQLVQHHLIRDGDTIGTDDETLL